MRYLKIFIIILTLFLTTVVTAQDIQQEHIESFNADIVIEKSGQIKVTEKIQYNFGPEEHHGIFRIIPFIKTNTEGKKFKMNLNIDSIVDENNSPYKYQKSNSNGEIELKIGDPNNTITGLHTYIIHYTVDGALTYFSDHDELYWNVTGNNWEVPIKEASAKIILPSGISPQVISSNCYTGSPGSNSSICSSNVTTSQVVFSTNSLLNPSEGLTIYVGFPKNIVSVMEPTEVISFFDTVQGKMVLIGLFLLALAWYIFYPIYLPIKWFLKGRDPNTNEGKVTALFESPKTKNGRHLTPAETGTLIDEHAGNREISALVVDLARQGYLKIIETKKNEFTLKKVSDFQENTTLRNFEKTLLRGIFENGDELKLKDAKLYDTVKKVQDQLYSSLLKEGYFPENPESIRKFYVGITAAAAITFNFFLLFSATVFGRIMPKKTLDGVKAANLSRSLKNFLTSQERQLEFQAKNQMFFEKLLPYAVAFGVEKVWAKRFEDIEMTEPDWYVSSRSSRVFTAYAFTNSLNSSLSSFNSAATPTTSSSGFSSGGGGFSGGGGGGGGGGSW